MIQDPKHVSVMSDEACFYLTETLPEKAVVVDGTLGAGGHSIRLAEALKLKNGRLVAIDIDQVSLRNAEKRLSAYKNIIHFVHGNFSSTKDFLRELGIPGVDGLLLDLGVSSMHLDDAQRGFSFRQSGPLDMRMGKLVEKTAQEILNTYTEDRLHEVIYKFGQERWARRIAKIIVEKRKDTPLKTTDQLVDIIFGAIPKKFRRHQRIHPATRTFQALRMEVNGELESLERILNDLPAILKPGARAVIISFHSLEDRLVKQAFRALHKEKTFQVLTKKPLVPGEEEIHENRRARSAKMRVIEKL